MKRPVVWFLTLLSAGGLALVVVNILMFNSNRTLQADIAERQRYISDTVRLNQLNAQLIQLAAQTAAAQGDEQLRSLLATNGITFEVNPAPTPAAEPAAGLDAEAPVAETPVMEEEGATNE